MKINEIKKKNGTIVYRASVYLGIDEVTGKKVKTSITARTRKEVKAKAKLKISEFLNGGSTETECNITRFGELTQLWLESYQFTVRPQTYVNTVSLLNKHILPKFGDYKLSKLTPNMFQVYINDLAKKIYSFHVVNSIISRILKFGVSLELLKSNPVRDILLPKHTLPKVDRIKFIDHSDLKKFLDYLERKSTVNYSYYFDMVLYKFFLATGCRFGEVAALEWSDIDFNERTISISKSYSKQVKLTGETKTKNGKRVIAIDTKTINMLKLYRNRQRQLFLEVGGEIPTLVFATFGSNNLNMTSRLVSLEKRCKEVGIPRLTFHAFRHTHASLLLNAGISYKELQHRLGHSKISVTLDVYSHLSPIKEKEAVIFYEKAINSL